jgi:hypothetical protein
MNNYDILKEFGADLRLRDSENMGPTACEERMAAEIVQLRGQIAAVLALKTVDENHYGPTHEGPVGDTQTNGEYVRTDDVLDALGVPR